LLEYEIQDVRHTSGVKVDGSGEYHHGLPQTYDNLSEDAET